MAATQAVSGQQFLAPKAITDALFGRDYGPQEM